MTLELKNSTVPAINELHELIKSKLEEKYSCEIIQDRWTINFSAKKCVLVKKSNTIGVSVLVNEKKNTVDVDGVVPNMFVERLFFRNLLTRLFLASSWNKLEAEVADVLKTRLS
jgi:hypothetical protein